MQTAGMVIGIVVICFFVLALIPCLGMINWINILVAIVGLVLNIVGATKGINGKVIVGLVFCSIAIVGGILRLIIGGGIV